MSVLIGLCIIAIGVATILAGAVAGEFFLT